MVPFRKMQGLGNDFAVFDARETPLAFTPAQARWLADRHFGIGCDTVVVIGPGQDGADGHLRFFNADGGESASCGNATRCVARLLMDETGAPRVRLSSQGGALVCADAGDGLVTVDMGEARLQWNEIPLARETDTTQFAFDAGGVSVTASAVSMGNPHCVLFMADAEAAPVAALGPVIETHPLFPARTNVEFAQVLAPGRIRMRVWERGVGVTLACGTGACATLVAAARRDLNDRKAQIILDGGTLTVEWRGDGHVLMTGPGVTSYTGEVQLP